MSNAKNLPVPLRAAYDLINRNDAWEAAVTGGREYAEVAASGRVTADHIVAVVAFMVSIESPRVMRYVARSLCEAREILAEEGVTSPSWTGEDESAEERGWLGCSVAEHRWWLQTVAEDELRCWARSLDD